jgi:hypothetical protein
MCPHERPDDRGYSSSAKNDSDPWLIVGNSKRCHGQGKYDKRKGKDSPPHVAACERAGINQFDFTSMRRLALPLAHDTLSTVVNDVVELL